MQIPGNHISKNIKWRLIGSVGGCLTKNVSQCVGASTVHRTRESVTLFFVLCLICFPLWAQTPRVEVQLSAPAISADESVILNVRAYGLDKELDASALDKDFSVVGRSSSRQVNIVNGRQTSIVEWALELVPKRTGPLTIPPINVGDKSSSPITLQVNEAATGSQRELYVEVFVDDASPFVQAQVLYTVKVYQDVQILDGSLSVPESDNLQVRQLGGDTNSIETVEGRTYNVLQRRFALFPQESGDIVIPPIELQTTVAVDRNRYPNARRRTRRLTRLSEELTLDVQPRPDSSSGWWLPARQVTLTDSWSQDINSIVVDQPVTRTIQLLAVGVGDAQLPEIGVPEVDKLSIYADAPVSSTDSNEQGVLAQQLSSWAIIPQVAGALVLPEVKLEWFSTVTGKIETALLPAVTLDVKTGPDSLASGSVATPSNAQNSASGNNANGAANNNALLSGQSVADQAGGGSSNSANQPILPGSGITQAGESVASFWKPLALLAIFGWLLSLILVGLGWRRARSRDVSSTDVPSSASQADRFHRRASAKASLAGIREACDSNDASKLSHALLAWGAMVWPESPPTAVGDIAKRLDSEALKAQISALDAMRFRASGDAMAAEMTAIPDTLESALRDHRQKAREPSTRTALPSL